MFCKWENGNSMPDISLLGLLARALNTSIDVLLSFHQELSEIEVANIEQELIKINIRLKNRIIKYEFAIF
ncbi:helix-turn-helix transcriptional regulator [Clostridium sp. ZBS20]|uniref:helix-turn-helix domain-containing protein n=1 Tax=Clostridium sp. ZBS20 TaxID=2949966 RepID=UPI00338EFC61